MNPGQERILCAATWLDDGKAYAHQPTATGFVLCGLRHHNIINQPGYDKTLEKCSGFLTNHGRFANRKAALRIAKAAGQLEGREKHHPLDQLMSEDLY